MFRELDVQKATRDQTEKLEPGIKPKIQEFDCFKMPR